MMPLFRLLQGEKRGEKFLASNEGGARLFRGGGKRGESRCFGAQKTGKSGIKANPREVEERRKRGSSVRRTRKKKAISFLDGMGRQKRWLCLEITRKERVAIIREEGKAS